MPVRVNRNIEVSVEPDRYDTTYWRVYLVDHVRNMSFPVGPVWDSQDEAQFYADRVSKSLFSGPPPAEQGFRDPDTDDQVL